MATRKKFVSSGFYHIRDHIAESTKAVRAGEDIINLGRTNDSSSDEGNLSAVAQNDSAAVRSESEFSKQAVKQKPDSDYALMAHKKADNKSEENARRRKKAIERRQVEYNNARRDLITRVAKSLAVLPEEVEHAEKRIKVYESTMEHCRQLKSRLESLKDIIPGSDFDDIELGRLMKELENSRLDYMSAMEKMKKITSAGTDTNSSSSASGGFALELASLSFKQMFMIGLAFCMPLMIVVFISALIVALTYLIIY